jgi:hypothetical protein
MDFEEKLKKPARKLTKRQLEALAEGRRKQKIKKEREIIQATRAQQRKERLERERVLNEQKEIEIYNKLMAKGNKKIEEFKKIKYRYMEKASSIEEYNDLKQIVDSITEEDILTNEHINKLKEGVEQFRILPELPEEGEEDVSQNPSKSPVSPAPHERFIDGVHEKNGYIEGDIEDKGDIRDI